MNKQDVQKILAGISIASLLTGTCIGCSTEQPTTPPTRETAPAPETTKSPAPGS